ncbi:MAG: outer membrane beta-barrel protein [Paludibacter sp.]|nr:outer membrane beta-barrel protein [Paludibacter sp.]
MKGKHIYFFITMLLCTSGLYAQLGIKAGVNMANEIKSFSQADIAASFNSKNLTGYQIGLIYQAMPKKSGLGVEIGALLSQKGSTFHFDSTSVSNNLKEGYKEINYLEVPFNVRYRLTLGFLGIYGFGGVYGGYALSAKTVEEITNVVETASFANITDRIDYGYNFGAGIELFRKVQLGATWSQGLKNIGIASTGLPTATTTTNRVLSFNLVYMF